MSKQDAGKKRPKSDFEILRREKQLNLVQEIAYFLLENKKWWMIPIILILAAMGLVVVLGSTGAAPFIYTLF